MTKSYPLFCFLFYIKCIICTLFVLKVSFFLFARQKERNLHKERKNTPLFSSSSLRSAEFLLGKYAQLTFWASPNLLASQTQGYALQTVLGIFFPPQWGRARVGANCERVRSTIANIRDLAKPN